MRSEVIETAATANGVKIHTMDICRSFLSISCASNFLSINHQKNIPLAYIDHAMVASYSPSSIIFCILMSIYVILLISMGNKNKQRG